MSVNKWEPNLVGALYANATDFDAANRVDTCEHYFKKTEPSELDEHGTLIWECVKCHKKVAST